MQINPQGNGNRFSISTPAATAAYMPILADLVELSEDLGASDFSLLQLDMGKAGRLTPLMDSSYPDAGSLTHLLISQPHAGLVRHVQTSSVVAWWAASDQPVARHFERLRWAVQMTALAKTRAGMILPLYADRTVYGMLALTGSDFRINDDRLADAHIHALDLFAQFIELRHSECDDRPKLSRRELECLHLTADGLTSEEIAAQLGLSVHTANTYLGNATQKLNAVNRMHAVAKAMRMGFID